MISDGRHNDMMGLRIRVLVGHHNGQARSGFEVLVGQHSDQVLG